MLSHGTFKQAHVPGDSSIFLQSESAALESAAVINKPVKAKAIEKKTREPDQ